MRPSLLALAASLLALAGTLGAAQAQFGGVIEYEVVDGVNAPEPLSDIEGDPGEGRALFLDQVVARCADCHALSGVSLADGAKGPALDGVGTRLSASAIRLWLINPRLRGAETAMPAYYTLDPRAADPTAPEDAPRLLAPLLTGAQIEHLVAFLEKQK